MATTVAQLADMVGGQVLGDPETVVEGATALDQAAAGDITLIDSLERLRLLADSSAAAVVVPDTVTECPLPAIVVADVHRAFTAILLGFRPPRVAPRIGISPGAVVAPTARIKDDVDIHPLATVGEDVEIGPGTTIHAGAHIMAGCSIGRDVTILPNVVLYENTEIGDRVTIHAGAILGAHGFGYEFVDGQHQPAAQLGNVQVGDDVEIGAGTTIDRGAYGATIIGDGTKIDNQVMIAHNCRIGRANLICSQVGIAGSSTTGDFVVMAGQVGVRDHVHIGQGAQLGAMSGISNDVEPGAIMLGIPATKIRDQKLKQAALSKLPELRRQMKTLMRKLQQYEAAAEDDQSSPEGNSAAA